MRLVQIREQMQLSQNNFAKRLNINQANLSQMEKGLRSVPKSLITKLAAEGINANWLLNGEGAMFNSPLSEAEPLDMVRVEQTALPFMDVPLLSIPAYGGVSEYFDDAITTAAERFPALVGEKIDIAFRVDGYSMYPRVKSGAILLCRAVAETDWEYLSGGYGQTSDIFVVHFANHIAVKMLENKLVAEGALILHSAASDNQPITIRREVIRHIWRVEAIFQKP